MIFFILMTQSLNDEDRDLLEKVFEANERLLLVQAKRMGLNEHDAKDCIQQVALYCCKHVDRIASAAAAGAESVRHFLLLNEMWQAYDMIDKNKKESARTQRYGLIEDLSDDDTSVFAEFEQMSESFDRDLVRDALDKMNGRDRTLLMLRFFEDMTTGDIAQMTGEKENTVTQRLRRAVKRFMSVYAREVADDE